MWLKSIKLYQFRNFLERDFSFSPLLTIIIGENARGKTNLLEAIYCLSEGTGFREEKEEELLMIDKKKGHIEGVLVEKDEEFIFQINFSKEDILVKKRYFINRNEKKLFFFKKESIKTVLFSPEQLEIITGSPEKRRQYFNQIISYYDPIYKKKLNNYQRALKRRNRILETVNDQNKLKEELVFWNEYMEEQAEYIFKKRQAYVNFLNLFPQLDSYQFYIDYQPDIFNQTRLKEVFFNEQHYKKTLIGPQKDDFQILINNHQEKKNIHLFGSRSQQRLAIFWLKMNEIRFYEQERKKRPLILLDDIFSELDYKNKKLVLGLVENYQTVLTTSEPEIINLTNLKEKVIKI